MWNTEREMVLKAAQQVAQKGLVIGTMGNVSMRLPAPGGGELLAITPSNSYYDTLILDDIIIVDFGGKRVEGTLEPSIETILHIEIYRVRNEVNAIVHSHSIFGSVAAVAGLDIPAILDDQLSCLGGEIKVARYAVPGSQNLVRNVVSALGPRNAVILANHGTLAVGRDMKEAFTNCEILEKTAKIYINALYAGNVNLLPSEAPGQD
jgi:L-fuculose-phosphate aldolase